MKAAIERVESDARINFPEREQARLKVKSEKYKNDNGGGILRPRQVKLGECNYDYIEVIEGLEEGVQVVVSDMSKYKGKE